MASGSIFRLCCIVSRLLGGTAADTTRAIIIPKNAIGIQATPIANGPLGVSQRLAAQTARKMMRKKAQIVPQGPLFLKPRAKTTVMIRAMINEKITSANPIMVKNLYTLNSSYSQLLLKLLLQVIDFIYSAYYVS